MDMEIQQGKTSDPLEPTEPSTPVSIATSVSSEVTLTPISIVPSITPVPDMVKPHKSSVNFAVDAENKAIINAEPMRHDSGGNTDKGLGTPSRIEETEIQQGSTADPLEPSTSVSIATPVSSAVTPTSIVPSITPALVKPRRPSVHFAVDVENKTRAITIAELVRQDSGGNTEKGIGTPSRIEETDTNMETQHGKTADPLEPSTPVSIATPVSSAVTPTSIVPSITPAIVKPRRPSVHFAVDAENKTKAIAIPERVRQDSGGNSSRKHRARKEKLVCRSECPTDTPMDADDTSLPLLGPLTSVGSFNTLQNASTSLSHVSSMSRVSQHLNEDFYMTSQASTAGSPSKSSTRVNSKSGKLSKVKPRVKRTNSGTVRSSSSNSRKSNSNSLLNVNLGGIKEPVVKKKKVIEIVSPRKRKMDHLDIVKTSSDPIFVRAANKPFKNKTSHTRFKFSRANLHKSSSASHHGFGPHQRVRHPSSLNFQSSSSRGSSNKQRLNSSPKKKDPETDSPAFPPAFVDDLVWLLREAESEFGSSRSMKADTVTPSTSGLRPDLQSSEFVSKLSDSTQLGSSVATATTASKLAFSRRRIDSESSSASGFEIAPGSPNGSQSFYHIRKDLYFSPSPSYATAGPTGGRRYSRRRHAKIHPPFEDTNCSFQGHYCPNSKVPRSQYCEKHLNQGPAAGFTNCRYVKDGRACSSIVPNFDTISYCDKHANIIARAEYDQRNPKPQLDQAKGIFSKLSRMFKEGEHSKSENSDAGVVGYGLNKGESTGIDPSASVPDIFEVVEEPDIIQEMPLGNYTGGLMEELDAEAERNTSPDKPDYDALKNAGYFTTEEIIQIHISKLRKLKSLYQREKELEWLSRQQKHKFFKEGLEKLKQFGPRFTTNPYLINTKLNLPPGYTEHQIKQYDAAKAILRTAYKADGQRGLLRLKVLQKSQDLAQKAKASGQKQHDASTTTNVYDSEDTDVESDCGEPRDKNDHAAYSGMKSYKCAYNEGYAVRACQNLPVYWSNYCLKHILSDTKQVQWVPCNRSIGPDPQDSCKTPCLRVLEKHGCALHSPLMMTKHKPLRKSEEDLNLLEDSDNEEEVLTLENESHVLANLVTDECLNASHLDEVLNRLVRRGPLELTDTSDSEETDEEGLAVGSVVTNNEDEDVETSISESV